MQRQEKRRKRRTQIKAGESMAITSSKTGYTHAQKNGNVSYTTAKGHEHIVAYNKKTKNMTVMWGKNSKL